LLADYFQPRMGRILTELASRKNKQDICTFDIEV